MDGKTIYWVTAGAIGIAWFVWAVVRVRKDIHQHGWKLTIFRKQRKK
jgi:hypothetical protein